MSLFNLSDFFQSDFTMVRLWLSVLMKFHTGIEHTNSHSLDLCSLFCVTMTVTSLTFALLRNAWKKQISSTKSSKVYYMGELHLLLSSTDLHLEFGAGSYMIFLEDLARRRITFRKDQAICLNWAEEKMPKMQEHW